MIYTVNWISTNSDNVTTTTDITKYVTIGFTNINKLGEELDTGSIELLNTERDTPYPIWDTIQVLIDGTEAFSMRIAGDKVSLSSKEPKRYTHNLTLVEHTKLLELFTISGKTFTQPTDGSTTYTIADVVETLFKVTPLDILTLIRIALETNSNIIIEDEFIEVPNIGLAITVSSELSNNDGFIQFIFPSLDITPTQNITNDDEFVLAVNPFESITTSSNIIVTDTFENFVNPSIDILPNSNLSNNDEFINFVNPNDNITTTSNLSVSDSFLNKVYVIVQDTISTSSNISSDDSWSHDRPVEWVLGGTSVTPDQTCNSEFEGDVGNVKSETTGTYEFVTTNIEYSQICKTDIEGTCAVTGDIGNIRVLYVDDGSGTCTKYTQECTQIITTTYYTCTLKT